MADPPGHHDADLSLVRRALVGDRAAFDELVRAHRDRVYHVALGIVRDPDDAADVTQETFIAVLRHLDTFDARARFSTWLYRITTRKAYDLLRLRRPEPVEAIEVATLGDPFEQASQQHALLAAIASLDEGFREAALLVDVAGLSIDEAAGVLDVATGTVKSRVFRARAALARQLGTSGHNPASNLQ